MREPEEVRRFGASRADRASLEESPKAYRRHPRVLAAQEGTIEIVPPVRPLEMAMAGSDVVDRYKG